MKFTIAHADLDSALRTIAPAIGVRSSHPILDCCLINAEAGAVTITGYNLELGITVTTFAQVETAGAIAMPYRLLAGLVSRFEADEAITITDGAVAACSGSYGLAALDAVDYPDLPVLDAPSATQQMDLSAALRACMVAVSTDASKQLLTGIHIAAGHIEATDGHRLMRVAIDTPDGLDVVLPAAATKTLQGRSVAIAAAKGQAIIDAGDGITVISRTLDGTYPNVAALIPATFEHTIELNRHRFQRALERVAIIAEAHNSIVKLTAANGQLVITAEADANNGREQLNHDGTASGAWAFNVRYLLDGLKAMRDHEIVVLQANSATTPAVIRPSDSNALTYLVMPVQIRS